MGVIDSGLNSPDPPVVRNMRLTSYLCTSASCDKIRVLVYGFGDKGPNDLTMGWVTYTRPESNSFFALPPQSPDSCENVITIIYL